MSPSTNPWAGSEGHRKTDNTNVPHFCRKSNAPESPLLFYERFLLCRLLVTGSPAVHKYSFSDPKNRLVYDYLEYLQKQEYKPNTTSLVRYLRECSVLNRAGGEAYVRDIFRGIPEGVSS